MASLPTDGHDPGARAVAIAAADRRLRRGLGAARRLAEPGATPTAGPATDDPTLVQALVLARLDAHRLAERFDRREPLTPEEFARLDRILGIEEDLQPGASRRRLTV